MKRISVIGSPGAGKTEFSKRLALKVHLPLIHLDRIYHDKEYPYLTDRELWRKKVDEITDKEEWIVDGNYESTIDIRIPKSDTIIFLDYPVHVSLRRAVKRRFQYHNKQRADMPSTWKENLSWGFFMYIAKFNRNDALRTHALLKEYLESKDVIVLKNPREARAYLSKII